MKTVKRAPLYIQVRQYLIGRAIKAGEKSEKLETERELCERFGVSRITVRKAIREVIDEGYLIAVPRQGTFTNPARTTRSAFHIGLIYGSGAFMSYECAPALMISGVLKELAPRDCSFDMIVLSGSEEQADDEIRQSGVDGLIWIRPKKGVYPAFERLVKSGFPVIATDTKQEFIIKDCQNHVLIDLSLDGTNLADYFINANCQHAIYCGLKGDAFTAFSRRLKNSDVEFNPHFHIEDIDSIERDLPNLLVKNKKIALHSDGGYERFEKLFEVLNNYPEYAEKMVITVDHTPQIASLCTKYPNVKISAMVMAPFFDIGKLAAKRLYSLLSGKRKLSDCILTPSILKKMKKDNDKGNTVTEDTGK